MPWAGIGRALGAGIFDYGNTAIEKRAIFYKHLVCLLDFGREREGVDLSKVKLTHHDLKKKGSHKLDLKKGEAEKLDPITEAGGGAVSEEQKVFISAIIEALDAHNDMSAKALNSSEIKKGMLRILLEYSGLWKKLRESDTAA